MIFMGSLLVVSIGLNKVFDNGPYSVYWGLLIRCCSRSKLVSPLVLCFKQLIVSQGSSRAIVMMEWDKLWSCDRKVRRMGRGEEVGKREVRRWVRGR